MMQFSVPALALNDNGLALKVNIPVAFARVDTICYYHGVEVVCICDRRLYGRVSFTGANTELGGLCCCG